MTTTKPKMIVRVEKYGARKGNVFGVYATETDANGNFPIVDRKDGHTSCQPDWYKNSTRPATILEEQEFTAWFEPNYNTCDLVKRRTAR